MKNVAEFKAPTSEVRICSVDLPGLAGEAHCPVAALMYFASLVPKIESYLKLNGLETGAMAHFADGCVDLFAAPSAKGSRQRSLALAGSSLCQNMRDEYTADLNELITSHAKNLAPHLDPKKAKVIGELSNLALVENGVGNLRMFPDSNETWIVPPADRNKTRSVVTADSGIASICSAVVLGIRVAEEPQGDLFFAANEEVPVIITLTGELPEIRHKMKIGEAQALWHGTCCLKATVRTKHGKLPDVVGEISISYM